MFAGLPTDLEVADTRVNSSPPAGEAGKSGRVTGRVTPSIFRHAPSSDDTASSTTSSSLTSTPSSSVTALAHPGNVKLSGEIIVSRLSWGRRFFSRTKFSQDRSSLSSSSSVGNTDEQEQKQQQTQKHTHLQQQQVQQLLQKQTDSEASSKKQQKGRETAGSGGAGVPSVRRRPPNVRRAATEPNVIVYNPNRRRSSLGESEFAIEL